MLAESNLPKLPKYNHRITLDLRNVLAGRHVYNKGYRLEGYLYCNTLVLAETEISIVDRVGLCVNSEIDK